MFNVSCIFKPVRQSKPVFFFYLQIPPLDRRTVVLIFAATTSAAPNPRACIYHSAAH